MIRQTQPILITIDPGMSGAMAVTHGDKTVVEDLPMSKETFMQTQSKCLHVVAFDNMLLRLLGQVPKGTPVVYVTEQMQSLGPRTPPKTLLGLTEMMGSLETAIRMVCLYRDHPLFIRRFQPRRWIEWMFGKQERRSDRKGSETKEESLNFARRLFPENHDELLRKKDHNRAEALLLTLVGMAELSGLLITASLTNLSKLRTAWRLQHAITHDAVFADIFGAWDDVAIPLRCEIQRRKQDQPIIKELKNESIHQIT